MYTLEYLKSKKAREDAENLYLQNGIESKLVEHLPKSLYKYYSINRYSVENIVNSTFTATTPTEFNDPYDSALHLNTVDETKLNFEELNKIAIECGLGETISQDVIDMNIDFRHDMDKFSLNYYSENFYVNSLSSRNNSILMWSHYTNNNKGICVEYESSTNLGHLENLLYPVTYVDKPIIMNTLMKSRDDNSIDLALLNSICTKYNDWSYESEWRIIIYFITKKKEKRIPIIDIGIPKCIYLGSKFISNYRYCKKHNIEEFTHLNTLLEYIERYKIPLKLMMRQVCSYQLDFRDISMNEIKRGYVIE